MFPLIDSALPHRQSSAPIYRVRFRRRRVKIHPTSTALFIGIAHSADYIKTQLMEEKGRTVEKEALPSLLQIDPKWWVEIEWSSFFHQDLSRHSIQDALRAFFQPIKNDDPRLDFYTIYKREAAEYDMDYVKKYDEDLNTTLIFVRYSSFTSNGYLTCSHRLVCSLQSAQHLSLISIQNLNPTQMSNLQHCSMPSSSLSTSPPLQMGAPSLHPSGRVLHMRSLPSLGSCMQAS